VAGGRGHVTEEEDGRRGSHVEEDGRGSHMRRRPPRSYGRTLGRPFRSQCDPLCCLHPFTNIATLNEGYSMTVKNGENYLKKLEHPIFCLPRRTTAGDMKIRSWGQKKKEKKGNSREKNRMEIRKRQQDWKPVTTTSIPARTQSPPTITNSRCFLPSPSAEAGPSPRKPASRRRPAPPAVLLRSAIPLG
jgi:hypothetical protein